MHIPTDLLTRDANSKPTIPLRAKFLQNHRDLYGDRVKTAEESVPLRQKSRLKRSFVFWVICESRYISACSYETRRRNAFPPLNPPCYRDPALLPTGVVPCRQQCISVRSSLWHRSSGGCLPLRAWVGHTNRHHGRLRSGRL
jgi:hypothetical protein